METSTRSLVLARLLRTSLLEQQGQPYIMFSQALGETSRSVRWRHLLPNAMLPLLSILAWPSRLYRQPPAFLTALAMHKDISVSSVTCPITSPRPCSFTC